MDNQDLLAFKDGVADAILEGHRSEYHENMYFYKMGYDYGITLYSQLKDQENNTELHNDAVIDNQYERSCDES
mgnify:FL=1